MKLKMMIVIATGLLMTACADKLPEAAQAEELSSNYPELSSYENAGETHGENLGETVTPTPRTLTTTERSELDQKIKSYYDQILPNCYTAARAQGWQAFFSQGGTLNNFIATLRIVSTGLSCNAQGEEHVTDPHFVRGYYEFYLPGCYNETRHAAWNEFFSRGGTDNDFRITLQRTAVSSPRPECLR